MKSLFSMKGRWFIAALLLSALALNGCSGSNAADPAAGTTGTVDPGAPVVAVGSPGVSPGTPGALVNPEIPVPVTPGTPVPPGATVKVALMVTGTVMGDANAALTGALPVGVAKAAGAVAPPLSVPLTTPVSVVLVDETGAVAASQTVTAADGNFVLVAPTGHTYVMLFKNGSPTGPTIAPLIADKQTGRISFSLPAVSPDMNLGSITLDSLLGKAWTWADPAMAPPTVAFPFATVEWRGTSDIPTERAPSPLFGAQPFTQEMMLFEEFGPEKYADALTAAAGTFPQPQNAQSGPVPASLENFLAQPGVSPVPTEFSNVIDTNPWNPAIVSFLGHGLVAPPGSVAGPAEGRPSGADWSHQSWNEFQPQKFYKTAQAPARTNGGFRDALQRHHYGVGLPAGSTEFAPGGLYFNVAGVLPGTTKGLAVRLHPNMPIQQPNSVWTFDGTLPPKLLQARYGEPVMMRHYNALPIDETANNGVGKHTITTHEHNGHSPGESDGVAAAFFFPGQFYDYRWPLQYAGYSNNNNSAGAVNFDASEPKASMPCEAGETFPVLVSGNLTNRTCTNGLINLPGDWQETMSTHWFHDHMLDFTSQNVYKGNAVMMNYYSAIDRGNESIGAPNLRFPSGSALNWGNRDYDMNLVLADKATDQAGQLMMNTTQHNGWMGDMMTVNWQYKPFIDVRARNYRFRILNGSVSRIMALAMVQEVVGTGGELPGPAGSNVSYNRVPFHMIANDGNILEHAVAFDGKMDVFHDGKPDAWKGQLPSQTIAERYDIVVDFSAANGIKTGDKLYFVNIMEHQDGKGTKSKVPLADILSEKYKPTIMNGRWVNGDPGVGKFMEFRVKSMAGITPDQSSNLAAYEPGGLKMLPLPIVRGATTNDTTVNGVPVATAIHHTFEYVHGQGQGGHGAPWQIKVDGGKGQLMDPHRIQAIEKGDLQVWTIKGTGGWTHPVHIHFEEGIILSRGGKAPPEWERWGKKDMYRIGPENDSTGIMEIAYRSRDFLGEYVQHCHNTMHEDHSMLLRWDAVKQGAAVLPTPMPTFDGVFFEASFPQNDNVVPGNGNVHAIDGDGIGPRTITPNTL